MNIRTQHNYYPEDMVPYSVVREHLRYDKGDADDLIVSYVASACDYMEALTNRTFCSSTPNQHENGETFITEDPLLATTTIYLDKVDLRKTISLRNMTGDWTQTSAEYLHESGTWVPLEGQEQVEAVADDPGTTEVDETVAFVQGALGAGNIDYTYIHTETYPVVIDWRDLEEPEDIHPRADRVYRIVLSGGDNVADLPRQYRQAMLMLVAHYDSQREAEFVGGLTTEVKEGVQRLMATVRAY